MAEPLRDPVFVVGCPRSGTTLLAAKLDESSELAVTPETHFFAEWLPRFPGLRTGGREAFDDFWAAFQISDKFRWLALDPDAVHEQLVAGERWDARTVFSCLLSMYAAVHGKPRVGEKTPTHYRAINTMFDWYPSAHVVFVVRDPRSVAASFADLAAQASWARGNAFHVSRLWNEASRSAERWRSDPRVVVVRYESFVTDPLAEMERLRLTLGLGAGDGRPAPTRLRPGAGGIVPSAEISADRVERWRSRLSPRDVQVVERLCRTRMRSLGYETETQMTSGGVAALAAQATTSLITSARAKMKRFRPDVA